jgi:DNA-binding MarR family transcriptional regulator
MARRAAPRLPDDGGLFFKLVRLVNVTARPFVETLARQHRLSLNEWRVMVVIANHPGFAAHEVVRATGLDKMSVSRAIAALDRAGRVLKHADPQDARRVPLELSAAGRRLFETLGTGGARRETQLFAALDTPAREQLAQTIERLTTAIEAADAQGARTKAAGQPAGARKSQGR